MILNHISFQCPPVRGDIFSPEAIREGERLFQDAEVRLVSSTLQPGFAGLYGRVEAAGKQYEVSVVVRGTGGSLEIDSRQGRGTRLILTAPLRISEADGDKR